MPRTDNLYGRGSVVRRPNGLYQVGVPVGRRPDGKIAYLYRYTRDPRQAERLRAQLVRDRERGRFAVLPARQNLGEYLDAWLERQRVNPRTLDGYRVALARVRPALARRALADLTPVQVQDCLDALAKTHAPRTVNVSRQILRTALGEAVRLKLLPDNPVAATRPLRAPTVEKHRPLTVDQARTLIAACAGHPLGAAYLTAVYLGLRTGEVLGLTWPAVDFEARTIHVHQQIQRAGGTLVLEPLKTESSRRILPLPDAVKRALEAHRERPGPTPAPDWKAAQLVFLTAGGLPIRSSSYERRFARLLAELGLPARTPHALRSGTSSLLFALDIPDKLRSELLGHGDTRTTNRYYTHTSLDQHRAALDRLDAYLQAQTVAQTVVRPEQEPTDGVN